MKKLLSNQRVLTPVLALAVIAGICLCLGSLLLSLDYRSQLNHTKDQLARTAAADHVSQMATYNACLLRNGQGAKLAHLEAADAKTQRRLISIERRNTVLDKDIRDGLISALQLKLDADNGYANAEPVDCSRLKPADVTSSSKGE